MSESQVHSGREDTLGPPERSGPGPVPVQLSYATPAINHRKRIVGITNPGGLVAAYLAGAALAMWVSLVVAQRNELAYSGTAMVMNDALISLVVAGIWSIEFAVALTARAFSPIRIPRARSPGLDCRPAPFTYF